MTRVALYTRVSTDRQEAENQRRQLRAFVDGHEGWKMVEEYRDEESGATGERYLDSTGVFRDALIGLLAALANQEGIRLSDRVKAGMARARIEGKHVGRPRLDDRTRRQVRELRAQNPDMSIRAIARETEVPYATTRRLLLEREKPPGN